MSFLQNRMDRQVQIIKSISKAMDHLTSYGTFDENDQAVLSLLLKALNHLALDTFDDLMTESKHPKHTIQDAFIAQFEKDVRDAYNKRVREEKNANGTEDNEKKENTNV